MFKRFLHHFKTLFIYICYLLFRMLPIQKNMILFESVQDCSDNSWAMYKFLQKRNPAYRFVWLCHSTETRQKHIAEERTRFIYHHFGFHSLADCMALARAGNIFYTHGITRLFKRRKGQNMVNLWHGIALKAPKGVNKPPKHEFNAVLCLSEENRQNQARFIKCDERLILPLGYPRNDLLLNNNACGKSNPFAPKDFQGKVIIWMPTFRASVLQVISETTCDTDTGLPLLNTLESISFFNDFLIQTHVFCIIKIHPLQSQKEVFKQQFSNLLFLTNDQLEQKGLQVYEMLGYSDALLTDYSSVFFDYYILDKPIGFILSDMEEYRKSRGEFVVSDPLSVMAGRHIYSEADLKEFVKDVAEERDNEAQMRHATAQRMILHRDANSCERIAQYCKL